MSQYRLFRHLGQTSCHYLLVPGVAPVANNDPKRVGYKDRIGVGEHALLRGRSATLCLLLLNVAGDEGKQRRGDSIYAVEVADGYGCMAEDDGGFGHTGSSVSSWLEMA
jgi:hypothetical protein